MSDHRVLCVFLTCFFTGVNSFSVYATDVEHIWNNDFSAGISGIDLQRFPRYPKITIEVVPELVKEVATGKPCLNFPSVPEGGYRLSYTPVELISDEEYNFSVSLRSIGKTRINVEIRSAGKKVKFKNWLVKNEKVNLDFDFDSIDAKTKLGVYSVRIWIRPKGSACLESVSLRGPAINKQALLSANLSPDHSLGVYGIDEPGNMEVFAPSFYTMKYKIFDPIAQVIVSDGVFPEAAANGYKIRLPTNKRGFFRFDLIDKVSGNILSQRAYVVINKGGDSDSLSKRYGMAMEEEHSAQSMVAAKVSPDDVYKLAYDMGVGSVRVFSLASPDNVSHDGMLYDFHQLDSSLVLAKKYNMDVLLELGSNELHRLPGWLRTDSEDKNDIDLVAGLHSKRLKKAFERTEKKGSYLSLENYRSYLKHIFEHVSDSVNYYEIWNEPGHKMLSRDYLTIAQVTREVQKDVQPLAKLLGPTSTTVREHDKGKNPSRIPNFISDLLNNGLSEYIDILSYHSRHAFPFMGREFDRRNQETGYVDRLRSAAEKVSAANLTLWDTERGVPWKSYHSERIDLWKGKTGPDAWVTSFDYLEPARRMPGIFAAAMQQGVERLFWFNMDPSASTIGRSKVRWGMFDADMEPMPHIATYDALTEIVGDADFKRLLEKDSGMRAYMFQRGKDTVVLVYNWQEKDETVTVDAGVMKLEVFDVMGNLIDGEMNNDTSRRLNINGWPQYIVIRDTTTDKVHIYE